MVDMIEDEILLSLPQVPMHRAEECKLDYRDSPEETEDLQETQKPFANLADLMKRKS